MKLLNDELIKRFAELGSQEEDLDPIVVAKLFDPCGSATWYVTEYDSETNIGFGYVTGLAFDEWGSVSIAELESIKRPFGLTIERDIYTKEKRISDHVPDLKKHIELKKIERQNQVNREQNKQQDLEL